MTTPFHRSSDNGTIQVLTTYINMLPQRLSFACCVVLYILSQAEQLLIKKTGPGPSKSLSPPSPPSYWTLLPGRCHLFDLLFYVPLVWSISRRSGDTQGQIFILILWPLLWQFCSLVNFNTNSIMHSCYLFILIISIIINQSMTDQKFTN